MHNQMLYKTIVKSVRDYFKHLKFVDSSVKDQQLFLFYHYMLKILEALQQATATIDRTLFKKEMAVLYNWFEAYRLKLNPIDLKTRLFRTRQVAQHPKSTWRDQRLKAEPSME